MTDKSLIIRGAYLTKPYVVQDDEIQSGFIRIEYDKCDTDIDGLNKALALFDTGEPIMILISQDKHE